MKAHQSRLYVRLASDHEMEKLPSGRRPSLPGDKLYLLTHLDGVPVPGRKLIAVLVRMEEGLPRLVYVGGSLPLHETWVYLDTELIAYFPGYLAVKDDK